MTDNTMRDKIAKHIYAAMQWACANNNGDFAPPWVEGGNSFAQDEARRQADAILAALPDMIAPLVWKDTTDGYVNDRGYEITSDHSSRNRYYLIGPDKKHLFSPQQAIGLLNPSTGKEMMDIANAHHRAAIWAAFGEGE